MGQGGIILRHQCAVIAPKETARRISPGFYTLERRIGEFMTRQRPSDCDPSPDNRPAWRVRGDSIAVSLMLLAFAAPIPPAQAAPANGTLADLSIQELMNIEVTSVSKKAQKLSQTAAAVYVITNEDIRRSGARNVPEALRLAPGVDVAFIGGGRYAVTIRGFNSRFANKLLVLIDGRSIYAPLFSGVAWEAQGPVLEDIERIEIIRGPGAAIWGANAVNGVINIITRHSKDTQGAMVSAGGGTLDRAFATLQYGDHTLRGLSYRVYGKAETHTESESPEGQAGNDGWHAARTGFRLDQELQQGQVSFQGEAYHLTTGDQIGVPQATPPYTSTHNIEQRTSGADLLARWDQTLTATQDVSLQAYYDFAALTQTEVTLGQFRDIDLEFEHRLRALARNDITWGLGYRVTGNRLANTNLVSYDPDDGYLRITNGFFQDEIALIPDTLRFTLGGKLENDSYTGTHFMPDARLLWDVNGTNEAWLAVGRALRTPSTVERSGTVLTGSAFPPPNASEPLPILLESVPSNFGAEHLTAYEIGYRTQPARTVSLDTTVYLNRYSDLSTFGTLPPIVAPPYLPSYLVLPIPLVNQLSAREAGIELAAEWRVLDNWRLQTSYSRCSIKLDQADPEGALDATPRGIVSVRSSATVSGTQFDVWLRHVGQRVATFSSAKVDAYTTLDTSFGWRLPHGIDVAIVGKDLLERRHLEIAPDFISNQTLDVERSAYLKLTWTY
jgi:iron complex outermembrane receptor protein